MSKVKLGIIGYGNMGGAHARNLLDGKVEEMELAALCDIDESRITAAKEDFAREGKDASGVEYFIDYKEMVEKAALDAVLIAVPHYFHPEIAIYCFEKGLNVITEKPAGVYTAQVEEMNEAAKKSGKLFGIMYNQRTNPIYKKVREMIQNGELGQLKRSVWMITNWYRPQCYYDQGSWRASWAGEGGGVLINQCPHNLDLWQWMVGMPSKVRGFCGYGVHHDIEVEDEVTAYVEYPNGGTGVFITTTGECPGTNRLEITGDKGKIVVEDGKLTFWKLSQPERKFNAETNQPFGYIENEKIEVQVEGEETAHVGILRDFAHVLLHGGELLAPGYEGINGLTISNAIHLSDWIGKEVELPIDKDLFLKLLNEKRATSKLRTAKETAKVDMDSTYNSQK